MYRFSIVIKIQIKIKKEYIYVHSFCAIFQRFTVFLVPQHFPIHSQRRGCGGKRAQHKSIKRVGATIHRSV